MSMRDAETPWSKRCHTAPTVKGWKGEDIRLPCHFQGEPEAVVWLKGSISPQEIRIAKAGFLEEKFVSWEERFDIDKDFSLIISDLKVADEGLYLCQVVLKNLEDFDNSTFLTVSSPIPPPLAQEQLIQQCIKDLKDYYRESRRKVTVDPLNFMERVNLDEIYTNLTLMDQSDMSKTPITYEDLLTNDESGKLSRHILIQGEGGVGKTTLCSKIAWDWCQGRILHDLDMVVVIPLRSVTGSKSLGGIIERYLSDLNAATPDQIDDYISKNLSKILLVFDGFDEFTGRMERRSSSDIIRILALEQYKSCKIIVTTRPWRKHEFALDKHLAEAYTTINVEGFNKANLTTYIERYFRIRNMDALSNSLISFMKENDIIWSNMAYFPIYCAMLCLMWSEFSEKKRKDMAKMQTFSELFQEIMSFLKAHYASKTCEHLQSNKATEQWKEAGKAIQEISVIALNGLFTRNLSFLEDTFKDCPFAMETCCRIGVLTIERDIIAGVRRRYENLSSLVESIVSFPHKLFQEYVAGLYVGNMYAKDFIMYEQLKRQLIPRRDEFRYLLYFASALQKKLGLDILDGVIKGPDRSERDFCIDLAFECHTKEAARAVGELWEEHTLSRDMSEHTKSGVVFLVHTNQVRSLSVDKVNCGRTVSRYLAEGMCSSRVLHKLTITDSRFHTDFYNIMGDKASICLIQDLNLSLTSWDNDPQHQSFIWKGLARLVKLMPNLSSFSLKCSYLNGTFLSEIVDVAGSCRVRHLDTLCLNSWNDGFQHQSSMGGLLAKWVFTMPRLASFSLECPCLDDTFFSKSRHLSSASPCQIQVLKLTVLTWDDGFNSQNSKGDDLAQWILTMPNSSSLNLTCPYLDANFFSTVVASQQSCQMKE
ncbi:uncharacterized protein [Diadema setosum]|uniref:uncharacterized protein n=1 Tax=Diadema setosum TaxID=31175 RepID=UPI003B3B243E